MFFINSKCNNMKISKSNNLFKDYSAIFYLQYIVVGGCDVSNLIGSDQLVAPYYLVVFEVMTPKSDFLLIGNGTITPKGSMNTANYGKNFTARCVRL